MYSYKRCAFEIAPLQRTFSVVKLHPLRGRLARMLTVTRLSTRCGPVHTAGSSGARSLSLRETSAEPPGELALFGSRAAIVITTRTVGGDGVQGGRSSGGGGGGGGGRVTNAWRGEGAEVADDELSRSLSGRGSDGGDIVNVVKDNSGGAGCEVVVSVVGAAAMRFRFESEVREREMFSSFSRFLKTSHVLCNFLLYFFSFSRKALCDDFCARTAHAVEAKKRHDEACGSTGSR